MRNLFSIVTSSNSKFAITLGMFLIGIATHAAEPSPRLLSIQESLQRTLYKCPQRIWPGLSWEAAAIVLTENGSTYRSTPSGLVPDRLVDSEFSGQSFTFTDRPLRRLVIDVSKIDVEYANKTSRKIGDFAVQTAIHEGFHWFHQLDYPKHFWKSMVSFPKDAPELYPVNPDVYYYNYQMIKRLREYVHTGSDVALRKAAGWRLKIDQKHPQFWSEILGGALVEGSATYVEIIGTLVGLHGCDVSESEIFDRIAKNENLLPLNAATATYRPVIMYDYAPYIYLAIRRRALAPHLRTIPESGALVNLAFANVQPLNDIEVSETLAQIRQTVEGRNFVLRQLIQELESEFNDSRFTKLSIPDQEVEMKSMGQQIRTADFNFYTGLSFDFRGESFDQPVFSLQKDPCGEDRYVIIVKDRQVLRRLRVDDSPVKSEVICFGSEK